MHIYNYEHCIGYVSMDQNTVSFKQGIPFYMGIASIATGLFLLSVYFESSWYNMLTEIMAFIAAGLILYLEWLTNMGTDIKDSDNVNGGGGRIFLDKPA